MTAALFDRDAYENVLELAEALIEDECCDFCGRELGLVWQRELGLGCAPGRCAARVGISGHPPAADVARLCARALLTADRDADLLRDAIMRALTADGPWSAEEILRAALDASGGAAPSGDRS